MSRPSQRQIMVQIIWVYLHSSLIPFRDTYCSLLDCHSKVLAATSCSVSTKCQTWNVISQRPIHSTHLSNKILTPQIFCTFQIGQNNQTDGQVKVKVGVLPLLRLLYWHRPGLILNGLSPTYNGS